MLRTGISLLFSSSTLVIGRTCTEYPFFDGFFVKACCMATLPAAFALFIAYLAKTEGWRLDVRQHGHAMAHPRPSVPAHALVHH